MRRALLPARETPLAERSSSITREVKQRYPVGILLVAAGEKDMVAVDRDCARSRDIVLPPINHTVPDANNREVGVGARPKRVAVERHGIAVNHEQLTILTIESPKDAAVPIEAGDAGG